MLDSELGDPAFGVELRCREYFNRRLKAILPDDAREIICQKLNLKLDPDCTREEALIAIVRILRRPNS